MTILHDLKYGARLLLRSPIFTLVAVLSIGIGFAAGTGIFAFMNSLILRPLGVGDGHELHRSFTSNSGGGLYGSSSYPDYEAFREATAVLASTCATRRVRGNLQVNGVTEAHHGELVSPGCFDALKLTPHMGRFFRYQTTPSSDPPP